jgi:transcription-repair coupling factor (superfamily II helicase)
MTADARKRLEAIESLEELGAGFTLATHDLEIRGAGELLGDEQSGQIHEIGFTLYTEMLEQAVRAIRSGQQPELDRPLDHGTEVDLHVPALLPEDYIPDVHMRLIQYKRIASADTVEALRELKVEMIDRFGLLPDAANRLFEITRLKLFAQPYGIKKVEAGPSGGKLHFDGQPKFDPTRIIQLIQTQSNRFKLDASQRLCFSEDLSDADKRVEQVTGLIEQVVGVQ